MSEKPKIKIFISSHKPADYVHNEVFAPIQVGSSLRDERLPGFICDNEGENISEKNPRYCELTAQYWAWKNSKEDCVGFFHYRRYLAFSTNLKQAPDIWGNLICETIDEDSIKRYHLDEKSIEETISAYDIILPGKKDIRSMPNAGKNVREQYLSSGYLHEHDLNIMMSVLDEMHPDFVPYAEMYLNGHTTYLNNMFIMRREIFEPYMNWLFGILEECEKRIDMSDYSVEAIRTLGHLAERLLNIYIMYVRDHESYKIKELPTVVFLNTEPSARFEPAFEKDNTAVVLSADNSYVPYVATLLVSVLENSSPEHNYDILIMHKNISVDNQRKLKDMFKNRKNFSLRFINISKFEKRFNGLFLRGHFTIETWFRLLLPEILPKYNKVLYLDSDLVVSADVAEVYTTNVDGYLLAACHDADTAGLYNGFEPNKRDYMDNILKIEKPYDYFQAGVILFNLDMFRKKFTTDEMLRFASSYNWELLDQDVLNYLAQGKVKYLDMAWNVMFDWRHLRIAEIISRAPKYLYDEYMRAHASPKIIHFAGPDKPWNDLEADYAEVFWKYARKSVYYEQLIQRLPRVAAPKNSYARRVVKKVLPSGTKRRDVVEKFYRKVIRK